MYARVAKEPAKDSASQSAAKRQERARQTDHGQEPDVEARAYEGLRLHPRFQWSFTGIPVNAPSKTPPAPPPLPLQRKLAVGSVDDPLEHEADRIADQVMRMPAPEVATTPAPPQVSRKCDKCEEEDKLQEKEAGPQAAVREAPASVHEVLRSPGQPLDATTRAYFEPRFGQDFSDVRVHTGTHSAESAREVHARAYTVGANIVFGPSEFAPTTLRGRELLAHELAHTIQQSSSSGAAPSLDPNSIFEKTAERAGHDVANGRSVSGSLPTCGVGLARNLATPEYYNERELVQAIEHTKERLKQPSYAGREQDLDWLRQCQADAERRARLKRPAPVSPPKLPVLPKTPPPDPARERAAAVAEAEAVIASMEQNDDADVESVSNTRNSHLPTTLSLLPEKIAPRSFSDEELGVSERQHKEAMKRIDEKISKDREISKIPYKERLKTAQLKLQVASDKWYSKSESMEEMSGEDVWAMGSENGLFIEEEKKAVYEDQHSLQEFLREDREENDKIIRNKAESDQRQKWENQGEQFSSPVPFLQGFAFAAFGPELGAAYAGTQTGAMIGDAYNACKDGTTADCAAATAQLAGAVVLHKTLEKASRGGPPLESGPAPAPMGEEGDPLSAPRAGPQTAPSGPTEAPQKQLSSATTEPPGAPVKEPVVQTMRPGAE
ncbi:MAG: DUF4157 domain-containing protein, partial [Methylocella sp.]